MPDKGLAGLKAAPSQKSFRLHHARRHRLTGVIAQDPIFRTNSAGAA
jgi:hypothetical protein